MPMKMPGRLLAAAVASLSAVSGAAFQSPPPSAPPPSPAGEPSPRAPGRNPSAPQPVQKQSLEYFVGRWSFRWVGRESALSPGGVVEGTMAFTPMPDGEFLEGHTEGKARPGPLGERMLLGFDEEKKTAVFLEHRGSGLDVLSLGDWTSPVSIRFKVAPLRAGTQALRLRRTLSVLSAHSFSLAEELSENGGAFQRLGSAVFSKVPAETPATPARD